MTSPYLDRPKRSIPEALDDQGMRAEDIGWHETEKTYMPGRFVNSSRSIEFGLRFFVSMFLIVGGLLLGYSFFDVEPRIVETPEAEHLNGISTAAGAEDGADNTDSSESDDVINAIEKEMGSAKTLDPAANN